MSADKTIKKGSSMPEFLRRFFVALKRKPSTIALVVLLIAFFYYSLNLTYVSNTTAKIQGPGMGLCGFATMLFSMLSLVCFLNAFPRRKKPVYAMVVLMMLMFAVIIFCDVYYSNLIMTAISRADNPITIDVSTIYIAQAYNMLQTHIVILGIGVALVVLMPLYTKLLRKINTSVTVEDYGKLQEIDISGED
jgi:hypothetical protein